MKIAIGTANFNQKYGISNSKIKNFKEIKKILNFLKKNKIYHLDTAFSYKLSENFLSKLNFSRFKIITKFKLPLNNKIKFIDKLEKKVKKDLNSFGVKQFEAILLHNTKDIRSKYSNKLISKLKNLKKKKLVKNLGISVYEKNEVQYALKKFKFDFIQFPANIFDQRFLDYNFLNKLKKHKIKLQVRSIFLQGLLLKKIDKVNKFNHKKILKNKIVELENWCIKNNISKQIASLLFIKKQKKIDLLTLGVDNLNQLKENLAILKKREVFNFKKFEILDKKIIDPRKW